MINYKKIIYAVLGGIFLVFILSYVGKMAEDVQAGEIVVIQDPIDGDLHVYKMAGLQNQNFGKATHYKKSFQYWFSKPKEKGDADESIPVKFYDGGHANLSGSIRVDLPTDDVSIIELHSKYGSQEAIEQQLIRPLLEKAIYMSGPLMSSKESYAEKKNDLIFYIEDQATKGVYKTTQKDIKVIDPLTGQEKTTTVVEIVQASNKLPIRQEKSLIEEYHLRLNNLSINDLNYDAVVNTQIAAQQQSIMQVQQGIANAKRAEQDAITVEQQGKADAAKAKWEQEAIKAAEVTEAEKERDVAKLQAEKEAFNKQAMILKGQGEGEYKRAVMQANGALEQKLEAYVTVQLAYAKAMESSNWVPTYMVGGGGGSNGASNVTTMVDALSVKTLRDLGLDMSNKK